MEQHLLLMKYWGWGMGEAGSQEVGVRRQVAEP